VIGYVFLRGTIVQKYILRRSLRKVEKLEIEAENFDDAAKQLDDFIDEPVPDDCTVLVALCTAEYIGDT